MTDLNSGFMFTEQLAQDKKLDWLLLSGHKFENYFVFSMTSESMQLVLSSREFAWHIYRSFCMYANVRMTFWDFFRFALNSVHSNFPFLESIFRDSVIAMEAWIKDISLHLFYLWMHPTHPFYISGLSLYIPEGWMDGTMNTDLEPSVLTKDGRFRITYSSSGVPYYLTVSFRHPILELTPGCLTASDYNLFRLMDKTNEFAARLTEGLHRYDVLMTNQSPHQMLAKKYHSRIKTRQPLDQFLRQLAKTDSSRRFKQMIYTYLPESVIAPDSVYSSLNAALAASI